MRGALKIDKFIFSFIFLCIVVLINDYFSYFFQLNYYIGMVISTLITCGIYYLIRKKIEFTKVDRSKTDIIFYILLFALMAITIVYPDRMYDSLNYHLYSQVRPFNLLNSGDFFPSSDINSYTYSFPDRVFYIFRLIFGFRLGLIFNYLCLIIIYFQIKNILKKLNIKNEFLITIMAIISIFNLTIIDLVDVYYTDFFSIIFSLELIKIILEKLDENSIKNYMFYVSLLCGMFFCVKISNLFFIMIFVIFLLVKNFKLLKNVKFYNYFIILGLFIFPFLSYLIYTFIETGNPIFPFYNTIFKSKYYPERNWMDERFGPKTFKELLIWPLKMLVNKMRASDTNVIEPMWAYGYFASIFYLGMFTLKKILKKKIDMNKFIIVILTFVSYLVWAKFVLGYTRYALFLLILSSILFVMFICDAYKYKKYICFPFIIIFIFYHISYTYGSFVYNAYFSSFNNIFANDFKSYKYNLKNLFAHDIDTVDFPENSAWGVSNANSGYMYLLNDDIPIYSLRFDLDNKYPRQVLEEKLEKYDNVYTMVDAIELPIHIKNINIWGYKFIDFYEIKTPSFLNYNNYFYIFSVEKSDDEEPNNYEIFNKKEVEVKSKSRIKFFAGLDVKTRNRAFNDYMIAVMGDKDGEKYIIDKCDLNLFGSLCKFDFEIEDDFEIEVINQKKEIIWDVNTVIINYESEEIE